MLIFKDKCKMSRSLEMNCNIMNVGADTYKFGIQFPISMKLLRMMSRTTLGS